MNHAAFVNRTHSDVSAWSAHGAEIVSRLLLVLAALELISMPLTQHAWTWDHFLHGGMDFESSLLFLVVCLCLLLVLRHHCRQDENSDVPRWRLFLPTFDTLIPAAMPRARVLLTLHRERRASSDSATYSLPLQI